MAATPTKILIAHPCRWRKKARRWRRDLKGRGLDYETALSAWVEQEEERYRLTCEALADVDRGAVIDPYEVRAWAESLSTENPLPVARR